MKHVKKHVFAAERTQDPSFFSYLTLMHDWHDRSLAEQRRCLAEEKAAEVERSVYVAFTHIHPRYSPALV